MSVRRVVTGTNPEGRSYVVHDGPTPGRVDLRVAVDHELWIDDPAQPDPTASLDPARADKFDLEPPIGGSLFRVFTFNPRTRSDGTRGAKRPRAEAARFDVGDAMEEDRPGVHTTETLDYGVVLAGQIHLELDEGEVLLTAGDVIVQRGTRHAWRNRSDQPCTIAFVAISSPNYRSSP